MSLNKCIPVGIYLLFFLLTLEALAFETIKVRTGIDDYKWAEYGYFYEDKSGALTAKELASFGPDKFTRLNSNSYAFGFTESVYWIRFEVDSDEACEKAISLALETTQTSLFRYKYKDDQIELVYEYEPLDVKKSRQIHINYPSSLLKLDKGKNVYFLRLSSSLFDIRFNHMGMSSEKSFYETFGFYVLKYSLHLGLIACMVFLNIFFYFHSRRDINYIFYTVYLAAFWFMILTFNNLGIRYFWPESPEINIWVMRFSIAFTFLGLLVFSDRFLKLTTYSLKLHWLFLIQMYYYSFSSLIFLIEIFMGEPLGFVSSFQLHELMVKMLPICNLSILGSVVYVYLQGHKPARFYLIAFTLFMIGGLGVNLASRGIHVFGFNTLVYYNLFLLGSTLEVLLINLALFDKQNLERQSFLDEIDFKNQMLEKTNKAYFRFVPKSFIKELGKASIEDVKLGDQKIREITIMFVDIRSYTSLTEKMSPEENTEFINTYFASMIPCVENNGGLIDKFIGDCIMALFFRPEDALASAGAMRKQLIVYNEERRNKGFEEIDNGIGIHTGSVMMATVGNETRLSTTVYSDAVNTAARLETLTKDVGASVLISEEVLNAIPKEKKKELAVICLGATKVKGKDQPVKIYQYFGYEDIDLISLKLKNVTSFERLINLMDAGQNDEARALFKEVDAALPQDAVLKRVSIRLGLS